MGLLIDSGGNKRGGGKKQKGSQKARKSKRKERIEWTALKKEKKKPGRGPGEKGVYGRGLGKVFEGVNVRKEKRWKKKDDDEANKVDQGTGNQNTQ